MYFSVDHMKLCSVDPNHHFFLEWWEAWKIRLSNKPESAESEKQRIAVSMKSQRFTITTPTENSYIANDSAINERVRRRSNS